MNVLFLYWTYLYREGGLYIEMGPGGLSVIEI